MIGYRIIANGSTDTGLGLEDAARKLAREFRAGCEGAYAIAVEGGVRERPLTGPETERLVKRAVEILREQEEAGRGSKGK